jgi:uncharacterized membrane protein
VLYLACYSLLGWVAEVIYVFARTQHLQNRGFLTGPFLPIYGIGAVLLILFVEPYVTNPFLVFVASVAVTSALEYLGSLTLDKLFHVTLWDYHGRPFNLNGRICLQNSLAFGVLALLLIYVIHPVLKVWLTDLPEAAAISLASLLLGILLVDLANSVRSLAKARPVLDRLEGTLAEVHSEIETRAKEAEVARASRRTAFTRAHVATVGRLSRVFPGSRSIHSARP